MPGSVHSLDTISDTSSDVSLSSDDEDRLLEQEWQESLEQLQQLVSIVLLPWVGKFLGRRWSHWAYARYLRLGLGKSFFLGQKHL
ncbi:hypothetical protein K466DRAFT_666115 [Polyporus arcularius HHB13444]|uniref:Uncharacterized protein n=1 Tax=Polyporus arcularius HHB13444 TaxID=1314778 RepID=A0A5C3PB50_9APHY|nr:hypothetical protein K466DRAFT_666115 [Polyporus arcularius HHB13444]